jgi:hypothetical protein
LSHCRSGGGGLRLTRTEEIRLEPDALFIEFFEHFKNKIKLVSKLQIICLFLFITDITLFRFNIGLWGLGYKFRGW